MDQPSHIPTCLTENYLSIPRRAIADLRDTPLALALYAFIARLYLIQQAPVPLSRGDIQQCDPSVKVGAIKRALDRLVQTGWLVETVGYKSHYTPCWGTARVGTPYPWMLGEARLGCPWDIWKQAIRIDRALFDLFLGKCTPHPRLPADVSGYVIDATGQHTALLQFKEIGAYILAAAGCECTSSTALISWNLIRDGQAQPIPDEAALLARASQRASASGFQLSAAAWRVLGCFQSEPEDVQPESTEHILLLIPPGRIGQLIAPRIGTQIGERIAPQIGYWIGRQIGERIGERIGQRSVLQGALSAAGCDKTEVAHYAQFMPGNHSDSRDSRYSRDSRESPPPQARRQTAAGGGDGIDRLIGLATPPDNPAIQALRAFGVHHTGSLSTLASIPVEQATKAIAYAKANELGPGWVVKALRRYLDEGQPIPAVPSQANAVDWAEVAAHGDGLFRLGSDTTGLEGVGMQAFASECGEEMQPHASGQVDLVQPHDATQTIQAELRMRYDRSYHRMINSLQVRTTPQATIVQCQSLADRMTLQQTCMGALRTVIAELGLPEEIHIVSSEGSSHDLHASNQPRIRPFPTSAA